MPCMPAINYSGTCRTCSFSLEKIGLSCDLGSSFDAGGHIVSAFLKVKCACIALGEECHLAVLYRQSITAIPCRGIMLLQTYMYAKKQHFIDAHLLRSTVGVCEVSTCKTT